jgi:hypothetical protein
MKEILAFKGENANFSTGQGDKPRLKPHVLPRFTGGWKPPSSTVLQAFSRKL